MLWVPIYPRNTQRWMVIFSLCIPSISVLGYNDSMIPPVTKKYLVTGVAGFIGHLASSLLKQGATSSALIISALTMSSWRTAELGCKVHLSPTADMKKLTSFNAILLYVINLAARRGLAIRSCPDVYISSNIRVSEPLKRPQASVHHTPPQVWKRTKITYSV